MKKLLTILIFLPLAGSSQTVVFNDRLMEQLAVNQLARTVSNETFLNSYEKQRKIYDKVNNRLLQIQAINEIIYNQLRNVDDAIKQGKQLIYLSGYFGKIAKETNALVNATADFPQYAPLFYKTYFYIYENMIKLKDELTKEIMNQDDNFLMDPYDRQKLVDILYKRVQLLYGTILYLNRTLRNAKRTPYIFQIPGLMNYANHDKAVVEGIMTQWKIFKFY